MKKFYGNKHLDPDKVHPSLFQNLQKVEQKDENENNFLIDINSYEKSNEKSSLECVYAEEDEVTSTCKDTCQEKALKVSEIENEDCIEKCHEYYEDCHRKEKDFYQLENKELGDDESNSFQTCMQLKLEEDDEERAYK